MAAKQTIVITKYKTKAKKNNKGSNGKSKRCPKCGRYM